LTAAILAGGRASRLGGRDKSSLVVGGMRIVDRQLAVLAGLTARRMIVANASERYRSLSIDVVPDVMPGTGALGGIYSALAAASTARTLIVACDMPFLSLPFLEHMAAAAERDDVDVVIPRTMDGYQPLCACYAREAAAPIRRRLVAGALKVIDVLSELRVREIGPAEIAPFDPDGVLFFNINTPDDYERANTYIERC
jgi:molybdopterin-guanine dinucleotide biosynthesis protein A